MDTEIDTRRIESHPDSAQPASPPSAGLSQDGLDPAFAPGFVLVQRDKKKYANTDAVANKPAKLERILSPPTKSLTKSRSITCSSAST